ncbi:MAG: hypothetical protein EA343_01125 [Nodularia sp. (in: Bacteria)]|nr:MAG: hypothetical protein EA343_01125 [Nodularia sp. (in: cyanobacteria)]
MNHLWVKYSNGYFGFSVQKEIYLRIGGPPNGELNKEAWEQFSDCVGWRKRTVFFLDKEWIHYDDIIYDTSSALRGHLPIKWSRSSGKVCFLASRLVNCNI